MRVKRFKIQIGDLIRSQQSGPDGSFILPWEAFAFKTTLKIVKDGKTWQADFRDAFNVWEGV